MRVLLAEDNDMNAQLFRDSLESDGQDVTIERDGLSARERALQGGFDLIVVDIQMPRLDGNALCAQLRAAGVQGPIIALSAFAMPTDIARGKEIGFDAYLTKPIRPAELRAAVRGFQPAAREQRRDGT